MSSSSGAVAGGGEGGLVGGGGGGSSSSSSQSTVAAPALDPNNKEEILRVFQDMTRQRDALTDKLSELLYSHSEYKRVSDTLEPMDKGRKAFQLINSVLVERTVAEVLPIVKENRDSILQVKTNIEERLNRLVAEIREFSAKYNVRVLKPGEAEAMREKAAKEGGKK